jgi:hypothetical protein
MLPIVAERMFKMLHWRSEKQEESIFRDHFFCPKCDNVSPYKVKRASVGFTFYYIPLFEIGDLDEFVVCQVCKRGFDPKILQPYNQNLFRLVWAAKCALNRFTPETLKSKLLRDGLKEPLVDKLIMLAQN